MHSFFNPKQETPEAPFINFEYLLLFKGFSHLQTEFSQGLDVGNPPPFHNFEFSKEERKRTYTEWCNTEGQFVDYDEKFEDYLQKYLDRWKHNGLQIINKHLKEISNDSMVKQYLVIQLRKIEELKSSLSPKRHDKNPKIKEKLEEIEEDIKLDYVTILEDIDLPKQRISENPDLTKSKYNAPPKNQPKKDKGFRFDDKSRDFLPRLHKFEIDDEFVFDQDKTPYHKFEKVFSAEFISEVDSENTVYFNVPITIVGAFISALKKAYDSKVSYASIERSKLFFTEHGIQLTATNISGNFDSDLANDLIPELKELNKKS